MRTSRIIARSGLIKNRFVSVVLPAKVNDAFSIAPQRVVQRMEQISNPETEKANSIQAANDLSDIYEEIQQYTLKEIRKPLIEEAEQNLLLSLWPPSPEGADDIGSDAFTLFAQQGMSHDETGFTREEILAYYMGIARGKEDDPDWKDFIKKTIQLRRRLRKNKRFKLFRDSYHDHGIIRFSTHN